MSRRSMEPCLCGDPECRRCFPVVTHENPPAAATNVSEVHLLTEPGERIVVLVTVIDHDVALRIDEGATLDDLQLIEGVILALLAGAKQRVSRRM